MKVWRCRVCGHIHKGNQPPHECPQCGSGAGEFLESKEAKKLRFDGKKFDVMLINGSSHSAHNTNLLVDWAETELKKKKISYRRFNLNELDVRHCWCCYSMADAACTYPCRDQLDDAPALHEMFLQAKAVIVASPINWNNMSARLKDFLDRLTCIQNQALLSQPLISPGKLVAVLINGHEDGAMKTAWDIFFYFQQMGFMMVPFGIAYRTHGAEHNTNTDNNFLVADKKVKKSVVGLVDNLSEMLKLKLEQKLKGKIIPVCE